MYRIITESFSLKTIETGNNIKKEHGKLCRKKRKKEKKTKEKEKRRKKRNNFFFEKKKKWTTKYPCTDLKRNGIPRDDTIYSTVSHSPLYTIPSPPLYFDFFARSRRTGGKGIFNNNACQKSSRQRHRHSAPANIAQTF